MKILLTGATGYVGGRLLGVLEARGHDVRCLVRRPANIASRVGPGTEVVAGDLREGRAVVVGERPRQAEGTTNPFAPSIIGGGKR